LSSLAVVGGGLLFLKGMRGGIIGKAMLLAGTGLVYYGITGNNPITAVQEACCSNPLSHARGPSFKNEGDGKDTQRPQDEVDTLMKYLARFLRSEIAELNRNNVRLEVIGQIYRLPEFVQEQLKKTRAALEKNNGLTLVLALSYGGRTELVEAIREISTKVKQGKIEAAEINEMTIAEHLYTRNFPEPDLLIRTSGEMRVSNFLLWQISYSEFVVTPTLWPEFRKQQFFDALEEYGRRRRRFGGV
jgi:undecaprenyl diphosphate synthase